ncbi:hypothetical protein [Microbacterium arabinogalactanolyticum]|uniref:hypothetical protein n=1 Tax=Microbacterium arabinogalactanolyticum TaxID=69365 RepID=UPI0025542328|nr:hypothetical protein [Microbacterium arabinogalactanolyticum]GLC86809.1 hypothetical protein MIAR_33940 [Microbacterium arabinogalactanolyticum]
MSTDGEAPLTRAQLRALRAAAEAAEAAQDAEAAGAAEPSAAERSEGDPDGTAARAEESRHAETTEEATAASPAAPPTIRHPVPAPGIVPRPAWPAPASQHPEQPHPAPATTDAPDLPGHTPEADTPDVGPIRGIRPESGVWAPDLGPADPVAAENASEDAPADRHPLPAIPAPTSPITTGLAVPEPEPREPGVPGPVRGRRSTHTALAPESESTRAATQPRSRRFALALFSVLGVLALVVAALGVVSLTQGPRISSTSVNAAQAIQTSGSRLTLTLNQRVDSLDAKQVSVTPAVPFTVDAAGRSIGIRFTTALNDDTTYSVKVSGVVGAGGGPASDLATTFRTPASRILLLQRAPGGKDDKIFSTDLTGERAKPVFEHPRIDDYRVSGNSLVVAVEEKGGSRLMVMDLDGSHQRELKLPGVGFVSSVQLSDRGGYVGYSYSDRDLTETSGRASVLVTQSLNGKGKPRIVEVGGKEASVAEWQFVPDTSSLLFVDFDGALGLQDVRSDGAVKSMGVAASILGVSRGTYTAIVERADGSIMQVDLTDGSETPLPASTPDYGDADAIVPFPGGTVRHVTQRDEGGMPTGQAVVRVDDKGTAKIVAEVSGSDAIVQTCVSPSGQYAAVVVAPDLPSNPYDELLLPLPGTLHTQLIDLDGKRELPTLNGFDISWCAQAPHP